jgi:uncharacterized membrane protein YccC
VASNDNSGLGDEPVEGSWSPRRSKASSTRAASTNADSNEGSSQPHPDDLVGDIEKTREELAETLDAIADRVSPKKVADRTKQSVRDGAHEAADSVKQTAAEAVGTARETVVHAADAVKDGVAAAKEKASGASDPVGSPRTPAPPAYTSTLPPAEPSRMPMLAGAGAALLVLLVLLKRRRR